MSAYGPNQTNEAVLFNVCFWPKADINLCNPHFDFW